MMLYWNCCIVKLTEGFKILWCNSETTLYEAMLFEFLQYQYIFSNLESTSYNCNIILKLWILLMNHIQNVYSKCGIILIVLYRSYLFEKITLFSNFCVKLVVCH